MHIRARRVRTFKIVMVTMRRYMTAGLNFASNGTKLGEALRHANGSAAEEFEQVSLVHSGVIQAKLNGCSP